MKKVISKYITKILISIILALSILICADHSQNNRELIKKYMFNNSFNFMKFKKWYSSLTNYKEKEVTLVNGESFNYLSKEKYLEGEKYLINKETLINALASGIVVYNAEKENFNNTIIIQGSDGFDIWYGNLTNINIKLYDYVDKNTLLGSADDEVYILITKDGKYYTYEEYLKNK